MSEIKRVLFVCLGNICRSPIAEAVFLHLIKERGVMDQWEVDSAALSNKHVGKLPHYRAQATLAKHNVKYKSRARQIRPEDFIEFDYIFGMDQNNISKLEGDAPENLTSKIMLLGEFDPEGEKIIRDPYFDSGAEGFERCYQQCLRSCKAFLNSIK